MKKSKAILFQPFPLLGKERSYRNSIFVGLFVTIFLFVFKPFGLNPDLTSSILSGVATAGSLALYIFLVSLTSFYNEDSWKVYHQLLYYIFLLPVVGFANFLVTDLPFTWDALLGMLGSIMLIGIIPISASVFGKYFIQLKNNLKQAQQLTSELKVVGEKETGALTLIGENGRETIHVDLATLLAVKAVDNYVEIFSGENETLKKQLLRNSLNNVEKQLSLSELFRCHRSWLVNLNRIEKVGGNSTGYQLVLPLFDEPIPVSRLRNAELKSRISPQKHIISPQRAL